MSDRWLYRLLSVKGNVKAATRGPGAYVRRRTRARAHRGLARLLRSVLRP